MISTNRPRRVRGGRGCCPAVFQGVGEKGYAESAACLGSACTGLGLMGTSDQPVVFLREQGEIFRDIIDQLRQIERP